MPPEIDISLDAEDVRRMLAELPDRLRRKVFNEGLRDVGRFLRRLLRDTSPHRTGKLRRWIMKSEGSSGALDKVRRHGSIYETRLRRPNVFNLLESGVHPHEIWPGAANKPGRTGGRGRQRRSLVFGGRFASRVQHPGFPARSVWGPLVASASDVARRIFRERLARTVREAQR